MDFKLNKVMYNWHKKQLCSIFYIEFSDILHMINKPSYFLPKFQSKTCEPLLLTFSECPISGTD